MGHCPMKNALIGVGLGSKFWIDIMKYKCVVTFKFHVCGWLKYIVDTNCCAIVHLCAINGKTLVQVPATVI